MIHTQLVPYLLLSAALFSIGLFGMLQRRSLIAVLISTELILNAANINFLAFGRFTSPDKALGQIYAIFVIGLAAAEVAIGLSIVIAIYRTYRSINIEKRSELKD
jgi:NADH:ubiquinone oxidoreductase subunit K